MSNLEFIEEWNNVIPFKIKEPDLAKPTEKFLHKAIIAIMKLMHTESNLLNNVLNEKPDMTRLNKIKFVNSVNQLYKVGSDSKNTFFYIDFVAPSPKKTVHVLKVLLNYLLYFNMVKDEVTGKANAAIAMETKLLTAKNQLKIEIERNQCRTQNIGKTIKDLRLNIKTCSDQFSQLTNEERHLKEQLRKDGERIVQYDGQILENDTLLDSLKSQIVPDLEAQSFSKTKASLQSQIAEQEEYEKEARKSHTENSAVLIQRQERLRKINETVDFCMSISQNPAQVVQQEIVAAERQLHQLKIQTEQQTNNLAVMASQTQTKVKNLKEKRRELSNLTKKTKRSLTKDKRQSTIERKKCEKARKVNEKLTNGIMEEREEIENVYTLGVTAFNVFHEIS